MALATENKLRPEDLTGPQKSAILCMTLGAEASAKVLQGLSADEVETITLEIAALRRVDKQVTDSVLREFREVVRAAESLAQGGIDYARELLQKAVGPQRAADVFERIQEQLTSVGLKRLKKATPELLQTVLRGEHPQTVALILAHLDARQAAGVVETMDPELAGDVLYRVARMEKVSPEMIRLVETGLSSKTDLSLSQEMTASGGPAAVANVLNATSSSTEKELLDAIADRNADVADNIRNLMFVFEDLTSLDPRSMQRLLRDIDGKDLALALKAASDSLKTHIKKNMSERAAAAMEEEMEMMGPVRVKDVENAQARIIASVRQLEESGDIVVASGGDDGLIT